MPPHDPTGPGRPRPVPETMRAWRAPAATDADRTLRLSRLPVPTPAADELLVRVRACGVCRTDLHVVAGDLPVHRPGVVPGHEVVGEVVAAGPEASGFAIGERV